MSRHSPMRLGLGALALVALAACTDSVTVPTSTDETALAEGRALALLSVPGCNTSKVSQIASSLHPRGEDVSEYNLHQPVAAILSRVSNDLARARALALALPVALAQPHVFAILRDPNGSLPPTKPEAISSLMNELFACVQLPLPGDISGAFTPGGAVAVIGTSGGEVVTPDGTALINVSAGAVTGNHLFTITPKSAKAIARECLPGFRNQFNQCVGFDVTPATTFAGDGVTLAMCTLATGTTYGTPSAAVHDRLAMASLDHSNPAKIKIYPRKPVALNCANATLAVAGPGLGERVFGDAWPSLARAVDMATRPFRPTIAYAIDGVGCTIAGIDGFTDFTTVDPVAFESGFEVGETRAGVLPGSTEPVTWGTSGLWNASTFAGIVNGAVAANIVSLAPGDLSNGALPGPFAGSYSMWFGDPGTGNYAGSLANSYPGSGGTSVAPQQGQATSPYFSIPNLSNQVVLSFNTWFEIESVNPRYFDQMRVIVQDSVSGDTTTLYILNPASDPTVPEFRAKLPYTTGGFNSPPVWAPITFDMSLFAGKNVRLRFDFGTGDVLYNGFRGWIVDNVQVKALTPTAITGPSFVAPTRLSPSFSQSMSTDEPPPVRVWKP